MITKIAKKLETGLYRSDITERLINRMGLKDEDVNIFLKNNPSLFSHLTENMAIPRSVGKDEAALKDHEHVFSKYPEIRDSLSSNKHSVLVTSKSTPILAHELGHLSGEISDDPSKIRQYLTSKNISSPVSAFGAIASQISADKSGSTRLGKILSLASLGLAYPMLKEEFGATKRGLKAIKDEQGTAEAIKAGIKLAPAQLTYLAAPALPLIGASAGKFTNRALPHSLRNIKR